MESEQLVADEVVARGEVGGNLARPLESLREGYHCVSNQVSLPTRWKEAATTYINDNRSAPTISAQRWLGHAHLVNLEPALALAVAGGEGAGALVHPDHDGALLVRPLAPDGRDVLPSRDGGAKRR